MKVNITLEVRNDERGHLDAVTTYLEDVIESIVDGGPKGLLEGGYIIDESVVDSITFTEGKVMSTYLLERTTEENLIAELDAVERVALDIKHWLRRPREETLLETVNMIQALAETAERASFASRLMAERLRDRIKTN